MQPKIKRTATVVAVLSKIVFMAENNRGLNFISRAEIPA